MARWTEVLSFSAFAMWASKQCGRPSTFVLACATIIVWGATGKVFGYSDTWQLIINTGTTIVTFLMVFLVQNTQNRDMAAVQIKLSELIRAIDGARNTMVDVEDATEADLEDLKHGISRLSANAQEGKTVCAKGAGQPD